MVHLPEEQRLRPGCDPGAAAVTTVAPVRVLVVEDEEDMADAVARGLRRLAEGFQYQKLIDLFSPEGVA